MMGQHVIGSCAKAGWAEFLRNSGKPEQLPGPIAGHRRVQQTGCVLAIRPGLGFPTGRMLTSFRWYEMSVFHRQW